MAKNEIVFMLRHFVVGRYWWPGTLVVRYWWPGTLVVRYDSVACMPEWCEASGGHGLGTTDGTRAKLSQHVFLLVFHAKYVS